MTGIEKIAIELFGFKYLRKGFNFTGSKYLSPSGQEVNVDHDGRSIFDPSGQLPDIADENTLRAMETKIANGIGNFTGHGAINRYRLHLQDEGYGDYYWLEATQAQRVAAALKVLEEAAT